MRAVLHTGRGPLQACQLHHNLELSKECLLVKQWVTRGATGMMSIGIMSECPLGAITYQSASLTQYESATYLVVHSACAGMLTACAAVLYRYETNLLNTAGQAMEFLADVNHNNAYVHLVSLCHQHVPHTPTSHILCQSSTVLGL